MVCTLDVIDLDVVLDDEVVLKDLNLHFESPGLYQVIGPNGAGKTTLLKTLTGLIKPTRGKVLLNGGDLKKERIGYVPQILDDLHIPLTAFDIVLDSYLFHKKFPRIARRRDVKKVEEILRIVHLPKEKWQKTFNELSGGERQRVLLARSLVHDPDILLLDEPLSSIDPLGKIEFVELIGKFARDKLLIVTSHDPVSLLDYTKKILLLNRSFYRMGKPDEILNIEMLENVYGKSAVRLDHVHIVDEH